MNKFIVWYEDGKYDNCGDMTAKELIAEYKDNWKKVATVTEEIYIDGKYNGEIDYTFEEFRKNYN